MRLYKEYICSAALNAGFIRARVLSPFNFDASRYPQYAGGEKSILVCALPYGNQHQEDCLPPEAGGCPAAIAPFARFNYYREAVRRMKRIASLVRLRYGGEKCSFRILCNSSAPEKHIAAASGLGAFSRNGLIISPEAGSLFVIAAMTLPVTLESDPPLAGAGDAHFPLCVDCGEKPPCAAACPTGAVLGNGFIDRARCVQWYASGHGSPELGLNGIPATVRAVWGTRLYGCTACQDACVHNKCPIQGVTTSEGRLPGFIDARELLRLSDSDIKSMFKGTAMGLSWLGPRSIRRNAEAVLEYQSLRTNSG